MQARKSLLQFLLLITFILVLMFHASQAQADFSCGPHMKTYSVAALDGRLGRGVRCLFFPSGEFDRHFIWYGEGFWGRELPTVLHSLSLYRHVGESRGRIVPRDRDIASAADIFGNGESTDKAYYGTLQMTFSNRDENAPPNRIEVRGPWNEVWTLEPDNIHQGYVHPAGLRHVEVCGKHFLQFEAIDRPTSSSSKNGFGVRCFATMQRAIEPGFILGTWYGEGRWNGIYYAHIGSHTSTYQDKLTAADICEPSLFGYCGKVASGKIRYKYYGAGLTPQIPARYIKVEGNWREDWVLNDINPCCAVPAPAPPVVAPPLIQ